MGTEIRLFVGVFCSFSFSIVKLNNPLMGTEMPQHSFSITLAYPPLVKLNNPLMGTEIRIVHTFSPLLRLKRVKLNNPLMGTEI